MLASGEVIVTSRETEPEIHSAASLGLGALGIILTVTLQCEPSFRLQHTQYPVKLQDVCYNISLIYHNIL